MLRVFGGQEDGSWMHESIMILPFWKRICHYLIRKKLSISTC
uniref:Uncharacterized protein n=1 Tax=Arundo donax TaxID=35708 RepID=A0A0A8Z2A9_ARUDO